MGAHAIFNSFCGPVGEGKKERERSGHIAEIAWLRMRLSAMTHKATTLNHTVETYEVDTTLPLVARLVAPRVWRATLMITTVYLLLQGSKKTNNRIHRLEAMLEVTRGMGPLPHTLSPRRLPRQTTPNLGASKKIVTGAAFDRRRSRKWR